MRYSILHPLESGPDVRTYLVADVWEEGRRKVLTLFPFDVANESHTVRFERLFHLRQSLDHPCLVRVEDLTLRGKRGGFITEYLGNCSLSQQISSLDSWEDKVFFSLQLSQLLAYLHKRQFFCGFLTPQKIFLLPEKRLVANVLAPEDRFMRPKSDICWVRYAAPEFLLERKQCQHSDLYSLGMIFYYLFTNHEPYSDGDICSLEKKQLIASPTRPRKLNPDIPSEIELLVEQLIEKDHLLRPCSADYVVKVLEANCRRQLQVEPRLQSTFVGRDAEVEVFRKFFKEHENSTASRFLSVGGPSGIGKTSLLGYFSTIAKSRGAQVFVLNHHRGSPFFEPFSELAGKLNQTACSGLWAGAPRTGIVQPLVPQNLAEELIQLLKNKSKTSAVVLCIDNLQWIDEGSLEVYRLLTRQTDLSLLIVGTYRTDELPGHWRELERELSSMKVLTEITLHGLVEEDIKTLLCNVLGEVPSEELNQIVVSHSAGNPFYVYELLRVFRENGNLSFSSGTWKWLPSRKPMPGVPNTVREYILRRLEEISADQRLILEYLALLERPIKLSLLAQMIRTPLAELAEEVGVLEHRECLSTSGSLSDPVVSPAHDWISQVIRTCIRSGKRKLIHRSISGVLEMEYKRKKEPVLGLMLVDHLLEGKADLDTTAYLCEAIQWFEKAHLYRDAARLVEKGLEFGAISKEDWKWFTKAAELFYLSGQIDRCIAFSEEFEVCFPSLSGSDKARMFCLLGRVFTTKGRSLRAIELLDKAIPLLTGSKDLELFSEVHGQIIYALCLSGQFGRAQEVVTRIIKILPHEHERAVEKLYHALWMYWHLRGDDVEATNCEVRAIKLALEKGRIVQAVGRIGNLVALKLDIGNFAFAHRCISYGSKLSAAIGNRELELYVRGELCVYRRKQSQHQTAVLGIEELLERNKATNQNHYLETELHIELAKNCNYQLIPERSILLINRCREILREHPSYPTLVDSSIALAWTWILLGCSTRALKVVAGLKCKEIPRERARYYLVRAHAQLELGNLDKAWRDACRAYRSLPRRMIYYGARARFTQGEILLVKGEVRRARGYIRQGLEMAKDQFYLPLMARGYNLHARWLAASGNLRLARVYCLRALQVMQRVERPGWRAEICHNLGRIEAALGNQQAAIRRYGEALQILKERLLHLSPEYRQSFADRWIRPIEKDREALLPGAPRTVPQYFLQLRQLAQEIRGARDHRKIGEIMLKILKHSLPGTSANVLMREFPDGPVEVVASYGRCRKSGKHLLSESWKGEQLFLSDRASESFDDGHFSLGIALASHKQLLGIVYLERIGQGITEDELDFLSCVTSIAEIQLDEHSPVTRSGKTRALSLEVDGAAKMIGRHPSMRKVFEEIQCVAPTGSTVLICGESGTGKELVARALHGLSPRRSGPFVAINCSALPKDLIESELFGHAPGSFTGAMRAKAGLFEAASGGTLFLDEIATMPLDLQARLLRVLEDKKVRRVGETKERFVDIRILAATNQCLSDLVLKGQFREDLYHRLNVYQIQIPPLRDRLSDVTFLVENFLTALNCRHGVEKGISTGAVSLLSQYNFPGNVRELENIIESAYHVTPGNLIQAEDVSSRLAGSPESGAKGANSRVDAIVERLALGEVDFWCAVRDPFLQRDLSRNEVREIVARGLRVCKGSYRQVLGYFNIASGEYKKFLSFLSNHDCKVDFHPFRGKN